jgi:stage II sporulation protein D
MRTRPTSAFSRSRSGQKLQAAILAAAILLIVILLIPLILVNRIDPWNSGTFLPLKPHEELRQPPDSAKPIMVPVFLSKKKEVVNLPIEQYVRGVLAAEMPAEFEPEALKAQAIAARTYIVRRMAEGDLSSMPAEAAGAIVTDTVMHQAYLSEQDLRERWGMFAYARNIDKLTRAVNETQGEVLTYGGEPIYATFFSTSNGFTEDSENYWGDAFPYLRSVKSPWDQLYSPKFKAVTKLARSDVYSKLGLSQTKGSLNLTVLEKSPAGRVLSIKAGGETFTGRQFRERLGLPSSDFTWTLKGQTLEFTTKGYGHGVGMSQWGANALAKQGKTAKEILRYYYTGVDIVSLAEVLKRT